MFAKIEEIFQHGREFCDCSKVFLTLATVIGILIILQYYIGLIRSVFRSCRLYFCSQKCGHTTDYRKKYGQWAVISGATDGIGLAMAKELARRGHSIVAIGRSEKKLANTKKSLEQVNNVGEVVTVKIDLSDASVENFEKIRPQIDPENRNIGILINNAGVTFTTLSRFYNLDMEVMRTQVNVNILAMLHLTRMILPGMVARRRGLILNVSSLLGSMPAPFLGLYGPSKTFIDSFSKQLRLEYSSYPIDIINLKPGAINTKLFTKTSKVVPSSLVPTAEEFAESALNAVSTGYHSFGGYWIHGLHLVIARFLKSIGVLSTSVEFVLKIGGRKAVLSPSPTRRILTPVIDELS